MSCIRPFNEKDLENPKQKKKIKKRVILMKNLVHIILKFCVIETDVASRTGMGMLVI
jgi:hypothetical protein